MSSENFIIQDQYAVHFLTFTVADNPIHTNEMIDQRIRYIHENPVRALIVGNPEDCLYSSARNYFSLGGVIEVEVAT